MHGVPQAMAEERQSQPFIHPPGPDAPLNRVARTKKVDQIADITKELALS